jgi:CRP-like cAMP-binding protein
MNPIERLKYAGLLREGLWFGGLPGGLQDAILERCTVRWHARGSVILLQESSPEALYAVLEGQVAIERWATPDQPVLIDVASAGTWFGELAVLLHSTSGEVKSTVEAVARTDARILVLKLAAYEELIDRDPDQYRMFARLALERYGMCLRSETDSRVLTADELLTARLADLADMRQRERPSRTIVLELTQTDVAALTGLSRQTVNAELHRLEQRGLVELAFRQIRIADVERLRRARIDAGPATRGTVGGLPLSAQPASRWASAAGHRRGSR